MTTGIEPKPQLEKVHCFLDEAGDTTFFGKGKINALGQPGISLAFGLGMVKFTSAIDALREDVRNLCRSIERDPYLNTIPSVVKRVNGGGFFFHAKDDVAEVRERLFKWIRGIDCAFEIVVGRKIPALFVKKHNGKDSEFYADLLSHLLKDKLKLERRLVLNIAQRGKTTRHQVLEMAMLKAREHFAQKNDIAQITSEVVFNVQWPRTEPLLCVPDYMNWAVQRVFERGEMRYYDFIREKVVSVLDLYDSENAQKEENLYTMKNPLTSKNKLGPPVS